MAWWNHAQARVVQDWARERDGRLIWDTWLRQERLTPRQFLDDPAHRDAFVDRQEEIGWLAILGPQGILASVAVDPRRYDPRLIPPVSETAISLGNGRAAIRLFLRSGPPPGSGPGWGRRLHGQAASRSGTGTGPAGGRGRGPGPGMGYGRGPGMGYGRGPGHGPGPGPDQTMGPEARIWPERALGTATQPAVPPEQATDPASGEPSAEGSHVASEKGQAPGPSASPTGRPGENAATGESCSFLPGAGPFEVAFEFPEPDGELTRPLRWQIWLWVLAWVGVSLLWSSFLAAGGRLSRLRQEHQRDLHLAAVGRMTARLAHEIKNPLGAVRGLTQHLQDRLQDRPELRSHLDLIEGETTRLEKLARQILDFARPPTVQPVEADLGALLREALAFFRMAHPDLAFNERLPEPPCLALVDPDAGRQILVNLLNNAREASPADSPPVTLDIALEPEPAAWCLRIEDRGTGLDPLVRDTLFEPFVSTKPQGSGLGLVISRRLAEAQGGSLDLMPRSGGGCTAVWRVPRPRPEKTDV